MDDAPAPIEQAHAQEAARRNRIQQVRARSERFEGDWDAPNSQAVRRLSRRAFPETEAAVDEAPAPINAARLQRRREAAATEAAALRRARAERAARQAGTAALVPNAPLPLRTTA
ncbi:hypothetical protein [Streptomyces sp. NPDC088730]|uniref:hypothetical protein n=1 Tax=Streptomyces sp. NPDC088730 TaxID=3365877 RepID=UPI0038121E81